MAHFYETEGRAAGRLRWIHVACTPDWTLYHLHDRRGRVAMDAGGVLPGFTGVAVHDGPGSTGGRSTDCVMPTICGS